MSRSLVDDYLHRVGLTDPGPPDLDTLRRLHEAHVGAIPFENLDILLGHGIRDGQAMITTLRHRLIRVPARLIRHARGLTLRPPPGYGLLAEVLARIRGLPVTS